MKATESEAELKDYSIEYLSENYAHSVYLTEVSHPGRTYMACRTDLVFVQIDLSKLKEWIEETAPATEPPRQPTVYDKFREDGPMTFDELWEWSDDGYYDCFADRLEGEEFQELYEQGYLRIDGDTVDVYEPPNIVRSVTAFELKRAELERGLEQAKRNLENYANRSYVVTDASMGQSRRKYADDFREHGIGLISVGEDGAETVIPPTAYRDYDEDDRAVRLNGYCYDAYALEHLDPEPSYYRKCRGPERLGTSL